MRIEHLSLNEKHLRDAAATVRERERERACMHAYIHLHMCISVCAVACVHQFVCMYINHNVSCNVVKILIANDQKKRLVTRRH